MSAFSHIELYTSIALASLIWVVQVVHYPMFFHISESDFVVAMQFHQRAISWLVIPLMLIELGVSVISAYNQQLWAIPILSIVLAIKLSTFTLQVPLHEKLLLKKDLAVIKKLVRTNWIRTGLWTLKAAIVIGVRNQ